MRAGVVGSLLLCLFAGSALAEGWIVDSSNGCGTSNPFPKPNESISWKGGCRDGKLDGPGTLTWYRNNIETERDQGNFRGGELDGEAVISYPDGHAIIGTYRDGQRHGEFIVTKPNGQVTISQYEDGRFVSEKQLSASEATARAPEIAARRRQFGDAPRAVASAPSMPARARATPEPVVAAPVIASAPVPPPPLPAPLPATPPVAPIAAARSVAPAAPPPSLPAAAPTYAPSPAFAASVAPPMASQAPVAQLIPPPGVNPAPAAPPPLLAQNTPLPPSRARVAAQPPSTAPSAILADDLRAAVPRDDGRIVLRPPKPRGSQSAPALALTEPAPPPNRARAAYAAPPRGIGYDEPIVLRPPKRQSAQAVPRLSGRQVATSVWVDDAALPLANPVYAGQAPVLRPPGSRQSNRTTRQQPSADLAPVHLTPPPRLGHAPYAAAPPSTSSAPVLRPPPLTPAVTPSPLSPPPLAPPQPGAPPRPGSPSARAEPAARYALSLTDADLPQAARAILGGALGEPYAIDSGLAGNVTLTPAAPLDRDQLLAEFRRALLVQGIDLRRDGGGWRLTAWQDAGSPNLARVAARNDVPASQPSGMTPASDAESRFVAGFGLERSGRQVEAMQAYNGLIAAYPDTPSAALARERLNLLAQAAPRAPMAAAAPAVPTPGARPTAGARAGQYLCTVPGLFGAGSLWCGHVTGEDTERYELVIRRVSVAGLLNIGFSKAPCTGETFISQLSVGQKVVVPKGCMAP